MIEPDETIKQTTGFVDRRPWGYYVILSDEPDHKVKRIVLHPGQRISLQRHRRRCEHWFIVSGRARVTIGEVTKILSVGQAADIPFQAWHRAENCGDVDMVFIEVQTGEYFGEDDIERRKDDYGRC